MASIASLEVLLLKLGGLREIHVVYSFYLTWSLLVGGYANKTVLQL